MKPKPLAGLNHLTVPFRGAAPDGVPPPALSMLAMS
jgi:hypothetical protein